MASRSYSNRFVRRSWSPARHRDQDHWWQLDWFLLLLVLALTVLAGIMIRSANLHQEVVDWKQHWIAGGVGLLFALLLSQSRYQSLIPAHWITYAISNAFLLLVIFTGVTTNGAQSWLNLGGFQLQPSEFAKVGLIITLASLIHQQPATTLPRLFSVLGVMLVPWGLIMLQPDLGTGLVFGAITLGMLYWGNTPLGWLVLLASPLVSAIVANVLPPAWWGWCVLMGIVAWRSLPWPRLGAVLAVAGNLASGQLGAILWGLLKPYQKDRLTLFLNPERDPLGGGYHLIQSRIAIGSGETWGRGLFHGTQTQLGFIPEQHTDFIFSAVGEELGFAGTIAVVVVFWLVCLRLLVIACRAKDNFGSLLAIGVLSMIVFQVMVNIGMTIGIAPITGIPLPWLSYGRSSLLTNFIAIGLAEAVARASYSTKKRL